MTDSNDAAQITSSPQSPRPSDRAEVIDFLAGLVGWYVINGAAYWLATDGGRSMGRLAYCGLAAFPINVVGVSVAIIKRRYLAWGMLTAIILNFIFALLLGVFVNGVCAIPFFIR